MDKIKAVYIKKLKTSSHLHSCIVSSDSETIMIGFDEEIKLTPLLEGISKQGWALPIRSIFRFEFETKLFLYNFFMDGET